MMAPRNLPVLGWSSVSRWTLLGTMACVIVSAGFTLLAYGDLGGEMAQRLIISSTAISIMLGAPIFFYFSMRVRGLAIANARLGRVARTDSLTACLNRGAFTGRIDAWLRDPNSAGCGALLIIDADHFKAVNDIHGHDMGDEALTIIARTIRSILRNGDIVGRLGGEEFGVFLPGVSELQAQIIAERIRASVHAADFRPHGEALRLSVSIGGAAFSEATSFVQLFRIADQRLYGAKHAGRNKAIVVQVEDHPAINLKRSA